MVRSKKPMTFQKSLISAAATGEARCSSPRASVRENEVAAVAENISPGGAFLRVALPDEAEWVVAEIDLPEGKTRLGEGARPLRRSSPPGVGVEFHSFLERWG